ncbi:trans-sulfuration enzyme family protein [Roseibium polysiphoniae]|uniref:PLP-dependent transferase n=1 Tax=Roseibium polysiphoniae TaxID=2571221 RepID=A0ABR9C554_9HYPH|nr:PLP-dependent aspartate aminotransferase family protein [Roseibium polysiphoniae]MBD8874991.1 PLP-dependent transferase [Roseibium polysiphoniae]
MVKTDLHTDSLLAHGGGGFDAATGAVVPPIQTATTFVRDENYDLVSGNHLYSRDDNDLFRKTEGLIAHLEGAADSRLFASGMAAIAAIMRTVKPGGTILLQSDIYWGTTLFFRKNCERTNIALIEVDASDLSVLKDTIETAQPNLIFLEVPSNPFLAVVDIAAVAKLAELTGSTVCVDATAATPLIMKPLSKGADLVVHSATKALNGHSDVLGGVVSTASADTEAWQFICAERHDAGAVMGSFETWLLLRGLRTLSLRVERMNANAQALAKHFAAHPKIAEVLYPGLETHKAHELASNQMSGGYGSLMSLIMKGSREDALKVTAALNLFQRATSLGGVESLVEHRETIEGPDSGIPDTLLRLSIGIEHIDDLIGDLEQALNTV